MIDKYTAPILSRYKQFVYFLLELELMEMAEVIRARYVYVLKYKANDILIS